MIGNKGKENYTLLVTILLLLLLSMVILSLSIGRYSISISDLIRLVGSKVFPINNLGDANIENVIMTLRLPRIFAAIFVGGSLALSGAVYQGIFQNPLVSPDLLGVSSGACAGAALAILVGIGSFGVQMGAFIGGIVAVFLTTMIPKLIRNRSNMILVMSGIIVSGLMGSLMGIIKYIADPETELATITYWQMGSIAKVLPKDIFLITPAMVLASMVIIFMAWKINVLSLGESEAKSLGINTGITRNIIIVCATLLTAVQFV